MTARRFLSLVALLGSCLALSYGQIPKDNGEKKALTRQQVADAYNNVKNFGCVHAGYESETRGTAFYSRYGSTSEPGLPKDPLDYLRYIYGISSFVGDTGRRYIPGSDRTWSSYAMRI